MPSILDHRRVTDWRGHNDRPRALAAALSPTRKTHERGPYWFARPLSRSRNS